MADPIIRFYYHGRPETAFSDLVSALVGSGLSIEHPVSKKLMRYAEFGELNVASISEHVNSLKVHKYTALPFWEDDAFSAFVSVELVGDDIVCDLISTDVISLSLEIKISAAMISRFRLMSGERMILVDLTGDSSEFVDWGSFFRHQHEILPSDIPVGSLPSVLGMTNSRFSKAADALRSFHIERTDEYTIASKFRTLEEFSGWQRSRFQKPNG